MPTVASGKVLVTGANGFIAPHVVFALLQQGYAVRGIVRAESKGSLLKERFAEFGDKFELVVVEDLVKENAFDEAVHGIDAIMHLATPSRFDVADPDAFIRPAVAAMRGLLTSALQHGHSVRRVILTSSTAAIIEPLSAGSAVASNPRIYTEEDWNEASVKEVVEKGRDASIVHMYCASKTQEERAAWAFVEEHKTEIEFDLVALNPSWVIGPSFVALSKPEQLSQSMSMWWTAVRSGGSEVPGAEYVDVRDFAEASVLALQKEAAGGNRIIVSARPFQFQHWVDATHALNAKLPAGDPSRANVPNTYGYDSSKAARILGIKYRPLEETAKDVIDQYEQFGWII